MKDFEYHSPETLEEACKLLKKHKGSARVLAGGTDLIPKMHNRLLAPEHVINIKRIPDLNKITFSKTKGLTLGSLVNFNDLIYSEKIQEHYPILTEISKRIASHQIRNLATIGGNLCNAAPSADSAPMLIALDSTVTITGPGGKERTMPVEQFFTGPGSTVLKPGELLTLLHIPPPLACVGMAYFKHTTRNALEIAIVGVAGLIQLDSNSDKCASARIVIAACAPTPLRVTNAEKTLVGKNLSASDLEAAAEIASEAVRPITDIRASNVYRREIVKVQCRRVLEEAKKRIPYD